MIQQRMARKAHDDIHYAEAVYKYAKEYAVSIHNLVTFICTNNSIKYRWRTWFSSCCFTSSGAC